MSKQKSSDWIPLAISLGCSIPLALVILIFLGLAFYGPEGGVRFANNMEDYALEYIEDQNLLQTGEQIVAYYDVTIRLNGSEAAILTDSRLIYHVSGRNTIINLADINTIDVSEDEFFGHTIQVTSTDGDTIVIEIMIEGDLFINALRSQVDAIQGNGAQVPVYRPPLKGDRISSPTNHG
ncbi:MAG: hypothetical protein AAF215_33730 [Cyanobacteria bacterium P01_A01_bin.123]